MDGAWGAYLGGGCLAAGAVATVAIPNLAHGANGARLDRRAIGSLRTIESAQTLFKEWDKDRDERFDYGVLVELSDATLIDGVLGSGVKNGYRFEVWVSPEEPEGRWMAVANPVDRRSGLRSFATNQAGVLHFSYRRLVCNDACRIPPVCQPMGR